MDDIEAANRLKSDYAHHHHHDNSHAKGGGSLTNDHGAANTSNDKRDPSKRRPSPNDKNNVPAKSGGRGPSPKTGKNFPDG